MTRAPGANTGLFPARRPLGLGFLTLVVLGAGLVGWGAFATISGAVIAAGQVEVETRDQVVEHIDGGTVGEILVRNGDTVKAGEVLIRLDDTLPRSEAAILQAEYAELAARRNRLEAEFRDEDAIAWSPELSVLAKTDTAVGEILDGQQRLFEVRRTARAGQVAQLRERIGQTRKQIAGLEAQAAAAVRQSGFIARELTAERGLFDEGLTQLGKLLALEREAARLEGQAGDIAARIAGARGRIAEIEIAILQIGTQRVEEAEAEAREAQARENQVRERLAAVRERLGRMEVRGAGRRRGVWHDGVRPARSGAPGRTDPAYRAGRHEAGGAGATGADPCRPGLSRTGSGAAVLGLLGAHDAGVRRPHHAGIGGCGARRPDRPVVVRGRGRDGQGHRAPKRRRTFWLGWRRCRGSWRAGCRRLPGSG